jgi:signal transduction histidine kinase
MALSETASRPSGAATGVLARAARFAALHVRTTVAISLVLICGSFAAAAALQMRFDRVHALGQASYFEARRAADIAAVVSAGLDAKERLGRAYADGTLGQTAPEGVRNIAVYAPDGTAISLLTGTTAFVRMPRSVIEGARDRRTLIADGGLATIVSGYGAYVVAVSFDASTLAPPLLLDRAAVTTVGGLPVIGMQAGGGAIQAAAKDWPVVVSIAPDDDGALSAWYGSLPLYLFVILGPAIVGAWLASVFVGEFERRARASRAVKALRAMPSADARLLVRLAQAERDAIEAQRSKAEFIAHMSHELRTPLNAVIGFSEIIERGIFGAVGHPKYVEYARDIGAAGRGLHAKIGDILEYANLEAGRYPIALAQFDVAELASHCVDEQTGRAFSRRIALDLTPCEPAHVRADPNAVRRILTSLLANALAYTPEGGQVRVDIVPEEGAVAVSVLDTGAGFKPEEEARAGNAFRRFDRKGAQTGAGLGLAIAVALARRMGGTLNLASPPGRGTRTELRLPRV